jgi:hypothetical protein
MFDRIMPKLMLLFVMVIVTAAAYQGFFAKWQFREDVSAWGIESIMDGTGQRPWVHRQLLPITTKVIVAELPDMIKNKLETSQFIEQHYIKAAPPADYHAEYVLLYSMCYLAFLASSIVLAIILTEVTGNKAAGVLGAMLFTIMFPLLETNGGYYYDFFEVLFFALAVYLSMHGKWGLLIIMAPIAEINKESFLFFIPMLYPFLRRRLSSRQCCFIIMVGVVLSGLAYMWIKQQYVGNPGDIAINHGIAHFYDLFNWHSYFEREINYSIPTGARMFFLYIIMVGYIVLKTWCKLPGWWKLHAKIAVTIQLPLYILFCALGELRNLSLLYMIFCVMLSLYIREELIQAELGEWNIDNK